MDDSEYSNLVNFLSRGKLPSEQRTSTKFMRHNFKQRASHYQLGKDDQLYKVVSFTMKLRIL